MKSVAVFALAALQCWVVRAQEGFLVPSANSKDFDSSFTVVQGEVVETAWSANSTYQPTLDGEPIMADDSKASLWLTSFDGGDNRFGKLLTPSVISAGRASWGYEVDLTDDEIDRWKGKFNYRLMKPVLSSSAAFVESRNTVVSRGFIIRKKSDIAASLASVSASYSRAAATSQSQSPASTLATQTTLAGSSVYPTAFSTGGPTPTGASGGAASSDATSSNSTSKKSSSSSGLSTGAKAGIAIGCVALVVLGAAAVFLVLRRRRANNTPTTPELYSPHFTDKPAGELYQQDTVYRHEAPNGGQQAYEMPANSDHEYRTELMGSQGKPLSKP